MYKTTKITAAAIFLFFAAGNAVSAISQTEAERLGKDLTPVGAEKAGNADGSIPEWKGGLTQAPAGYQPGQFLVDPFADDKPLFVITAQNMEQYKNRLTPGQMAMLKKYPDFKMLVYPSRRTAAYSQEIYDEVKTHAVMAKLTSGGNGVEGRGLHAPFPIPENGLEAIWNHALRFRGLSHKRTTVQMPVQENGSFVANRFVDIWAFPESFSGGRDAKKDSNISAYFMQIMKSPPRLTGNVLLVHETLDQVKQPRKAWRYNAGQRRVRRAPQVAYDAPGTGADGLRTVDNFDMFNGAPDRYNWKLLGKKELYIPYNAYKLHSPDLSYEQIHQKGHLNPELTRYELHRVWVVEATLKEGARHIYGKRTFYLDEDTWQASVIDHYDTRGNLWRVGEAHAIQYYHEKIPFYTAEALYDLQSGRYLTIGLTNEEKEPYIFNIGEQRKSFQPAALRRAGKR